MQIKEPTKPDCTIEHDPAAWCHYFTLKEREAGLKKAYYKRRASIYHFLSSRLETKAKNRFRDMFASYREPVNWEDNPDAKPLPVDVAKIYAYRDKQYIRLLERSQRTARKEYICRASAEEYEVQENYFADTWVEVLNKWKLEYAHNYKQTHASQQVRHG